MKISDDPFVRELLPEFVDTWITDISAQFKSLVENKNVDDLYRMAHTLKGSCFQFGIDDVANLGIELMGYCKAKDWQSIVPMEQKLLKALYNMKNFLDENL